MLRQPTSNRVLVNHGIEEEQSDIRAHVCVRARKMYVFPTQVARDMIATGSHPFTQTKTGPVVTSRGYLLPVTQIPNILTFEIPRSWIEEIGFIEGEDSSKSGRKAEQVVMRFMDKRWFQYQAGVISVLDRQEQINGVDLLVSFKGRIQVKCDWNGGGVGRRQDGCTGNVYIETEECNPFQRH